MFGKNVKTILGAVLFHSAVLLSSALSFPVLSVAQGIPVFDAANVANTLLTAQRSLEQVNNQLKMLESLDFDGTSDLTQILGQTTELLNQVEGVAYNMGQIEQEFTALYPETMEGMTYDELHSLKENLLIQTRNAQKHAMEVQASIAQAIPQTKGTVDNIVRESSQAPGPTAAIQANTQLLAILSAQLSEMQALLMAQTRALNSYIQEQNTRSSVAAEQRKKMFEGIERVDVRSDGVNPLDY